MGCMACTEPQCLYQGALYFTLGLHVFSGVYLNKLLCLWCAVSENSSIYGVHYVRCFVARKQKQSQ